MEEALFEKIVQEVAQQPLLSTVSLTLQNEPLLDKRIFEWVKYLKIHAPDKNCVLTTNGELLDQFEMDEIARSGLDVLIVSVNALSKRVYQSVNLGLDYDRVFRNIDSLLSNPDLKSKLALSFVPTKENESELTQFARYWKGKGVKVTIISLENRAGSVPDFKRIRLVSDSSSRSIFSRLLTSVISQVRKRYGCVVPFFQMNILFNGDAILCCHDWERAPVLGNVDTESLSEIWNSEKSNSIRRLLGRGEFQEIGPCEDCSLVQ